MKIKLAIIFAAICTIKLSWAAMSIEVSNTVMSPEQPITITLADNKYFLINGQESGYWRIIEPNESPKKVIGLGSSSPYLFKKDTYELYLKDSSSNNITALTFSKITKSQNPRIPALIYEAPQTYVDSISGSDITGYLTNSKGEKIEKTLDFSPKGKDISIQLK